MSTVENVRKRFEREGFGQVMEAALSLDVELPDCREKEIAIAKLEEAAMWADKACRMA